MTLRSAATAPPIVSFCDVPTTSMPCSLLPSPVDPGAPDPPVPRDEVAGTGRRATERVAGGAGGDQHAGAVGDRGGAGGIGAEEVARDDVAHRARAIDLDARPDVARDDVRGARGRPADR